MHRVILALCVVAVVSSTTALAAAAAAKSRDAVVLTVHLNSATATEEEVEAAFVHRSTPGDALFRKHLSVEELTALVGARAATIERVTSFLTAHGAVDVRVLRTRDVVVARVPRSARGLAALGLGPKDFDASHPAAFRKVVSVPALEKGGDVFAVLVAAGSLVNGKRPSRFHSLRVRSAAGSSSGSGSNAMEITPQVIFQRYNVPTTPQKFPKGFSQGVAEFQQSRFRPQDITKFSKFYKLPVPKVLVRGPNDVGSSDDLEGTLDLEYISAVSGGIPTYWLSQHTTNNPNPFGLDFTLWAEEVLAVKPAPTTVSVSWGLGDYNYEPSLLKWLLADNKAFRKLGLLGVSVLVASGDSGPGTRQGSSCTQFMPSWPASSPYVTSVGATFANSASESEESVNWSGGGFSDIFPQPVWQKAAVEKYLKQKGVPPKALFDGKNRGYPDVSALGVNFNIYAPSGPGAPGTWEEVSGTSCASPTFAAVISRINAERKLANKPSLGFLNPALYKLGKVGQDIVKGQSIYTNCDTGNIPGFPALPGWDAVSGLGTPDYEFLAKHL